jgi:predicted nucleic acid-binding protein
MILVDTSAWIDHFRRPNALLIEHLNQRQVCGDPFVTGELALGSLQQRKAILALMQDLPQATIATEDEVFRFIEQNSLYGLGIGYVDAHLLAAVRLSPGTSLWSLDKRLQGVAEKLSVAPPN